MMFRFTLSHDILGELEISPPDGWKDAVLKLERDKNFHSLIEYFDGSFIFYGNNGEVNGGIDFIREVEREYGLDADLNILIEITVDGYSYETVFEGLLKLEAIQEMQDNKMQIPIIRNDFWSKFINRLETPIDIQSPKSLDDESVDQFDQVNLRLSSQKIQQSYRSELAVSYVVSNPTWNGSGIPPSRTITTQFNDDWLQFSFDPVLDEINEVYNLPIAFNIIRPVASITVEYAGEYVVSGQVLCGIIVGNELFGPGRIYATGVHELDDTDVLNFFYQVNDGPIIPFDIYVAPVSLGGGSNVSQFSLSPVTLILNSNDSVRIYGKSEDEQTEESISTEDGIGLYIVGKQTTNISVSSMGGSLPDDVTSTGEPDTEIPYSWIDVRGQTIFPETNAFSFLIHDVGGHISDRIISRDNSFYSEYLGSDRTIYRQYEGDGCGWKYALVKGLQLRQYSLIEKPFFQSFKSWWDGANPILNLGLGYEEIDGYEVIRVEEKEHFFDDEVSIYIDNVRDIQRVYDQERIFKTVKIGYKQWQSENISGIDDPQTKHTYASRLKKSGTDITLESEFIAASLAIETTRRTTREKSADYKFDNETFIISINPIPIDVSPETSPDVNDYGPELDGTFTSISNLLNSETRYNSRITPARNMIRWLPYLSAGLQSYLDSVFKFTSGEGNYDMISDMSNTSDGCDEYKLPISEKQDIPVYDDPTHLALLYEINIPLEWDEYKTIRDNRKKAIGISQTSADHVKFFIKELAYDVTKSVAKVTAWAKEFMPIEVIEYTPAMIRCSPITEFPLTVDNTSITVDSTEITVDQTEYTI